MSTVTAIPARTRPAPQPTGGVTQLRLIRSEWTKLWSLRSTRWALLVAFLAQAALPVLIAAVQMGRWNQLSPHDQATYSSIDTAVAGWRLSQLAIGVLGVLVISGEYSTGMIRSSLMAAPKRLPVLWAKIAVFASVTFVLMLVSAFIAFFAVQAVVTQHHLQHSLGDPGALRAVVGVALYLTALGVLCTGLGTLLRNTAGGIAGFVLLLLVLPLIVDILPTSLNQTVSKFLPLQSGVAVASIHQDGPHLAPWAGFGVFLVYMVVAVIAGAAVLWRKDA